MTDEELNELWHILASAANVKDLDYGEAVTIGGVFGQMKAEIKTLQRANKRQSDLNINSLHALKDMYAEIRRYRKILQAILEAEEQYCDGFETEIYQLAEAGLENIIKEGEKE